MKFFCGQNYIKKFVEYCKLPTNYSIQLHTAKYLKNDLITLFKVI